MLVRSVADSKWTVVAVMGGFALVNNNKVTILVNEAELGSVRVARIFVFMNVLNLDFGFNLSFVTFYVILYIESNKKLEIETKKLCSS